MGYIQGSRDNSQTIMRIDLNKYDKLDIHMSKYMYKYELYLSLKPCIKSNQKCTCILFKTNFKTFLKYKQSQIKCIISILRHTFLHFNLEYRLYLIW